MLKKERERNAHPLALPLRKGYPPPGGKPRARYPLAAQFAPQGNQAERSETEQGKGRSAIGNTHSSRLNADVVEEPCSTLEKRKKSELQFRMGSRSGPRKRILGVIEIRLICQA